MECALVSKLPEGSDWTYEIKLDGYRAVRVKTNREAILYSRNGKNFNKRFPQIAQALRDLPAETVIDGEVVALDESGRPDFHRLQHFQAEASRIRYFLFDLLVSNGRDLTKLPLIERRKLLTAVKMRSSWIRISEQFNISAADMIAAVRKQQLEGVVAKRSDSLYEAGKRTGSWVKMRIKRAGVRHRRIYSRTTWGRFNHRWLLSRQGFGLRRQNEKRICASNPQDGLREAEAA